VSDIKTEGTPPPDANTALESFSCIIRCTLLHVLGSYYIYQY